jgi:uncharacterized protein
MSPEERNLVIQLFDRLTTLEDAARDPEAERLIKDGLRQAPNAPYALVQTVLVQDEALRRADARIRELESQEAAPARDTSFLGGMRDSLFGRSEPRGSVPTVRPGDSPGMSPAWRSSAAASAPMANPSVQMANPSAPSMGGSFLGTAASAAAGVIGGSLLLEGIRSMMGHHGGAHAAFDPGVTSPAPWSGGAPDELSRQAGIGDIGRSPRSSADPSYGLFDANAEPVEDGQERDDIDDSDIDDDGLDLDDGSDQ